MIIIHTFPVKWGITINSTNSSKKKFTENKIRMPHFLFDKSHSPPNNEVKNGENRWTGKRLRDSRIE